MARLLGIHSQFNTVICFMYPEGNLKLVKLQRGTNLRSQVGSSAYLSGVWDCQLHNLTTLRTINFLFDFLNVKVGQGEFLSMSSPDARTNQQRNF